MKDIELNMMKVRAWKLDGGQFLVLLFFRTQEGRLELLHERQVETEAEVHGVIREAQERLLEATKHAGFPSAKVFAQMAGAKKA